MTVTATTARKTFVRKSDGAKFTYSVFDSREEAQRFAGANPVKVRNASGALIARSALVVSLPNGQYGVAA